MKFNHPVWLNQGTGYGFGGQYRAIIHASDGFGDGPFSRTDNVFRGDGCWPFVKINNYDNNSLTSISIILHYIGGRNGGGRSNHR